MVHVWVGQGPTDNGLRGSKGQQLITRYATSSGILAGMERVTVQEIYCPSLLPSRAALASRIGPVCHQSQCGNARGIGECLRPEWHVELRAASNAGGCHRFPVLPTGFRGNSRDDGSQARAHVQEYRSGDDGRGVR